MDFTSINKLFEQSIRNNWERPALSNYQGVTLAYKDVAASICQLHFAFKKLGLKKGDKVALCSRNQANWGVCFLATMTYGAVPIPILHEFKPENIHYLVNHSEAKVLFVDEFIWEGLSEQEMPDLSVIVQISTLECLYARKANFQYTREGLQKEFENMYPEGLKPEDVKFKKESPESLAIINYTSGTSGFSKGVMIPYRALLCNLQFATEFAEPQMNCESELVAMLPLAHMYGLTIEFLHTFIIGGQIHFLTRLPSPKIIMNAFSEIHPDLIISVPLIIEKVYKSQIKPIADRTKFFRSIPILGQAVRSKIRNGMIEAFGGRFEEIILGGAPFNPEVEEFLRSIDFPFTVGYGMTECAPVITYSKWSKTKKGSCGQAIPGCRIRIDSPDPQNTPGEIQVSGDNLFTGYYKNKKASKEVFTDDGWLRTGDIGVMDSDGYLYLKGRSKCMILGPSGQNIYPEELEAVINNASYVVDSLIIEENGGLTALIYPDYHLAEQDGISREELMERIRTNLPEINKVLPAYAQIRKVEFMPEDFERTPKRNIKRYLYQRN